MSDITDEDIHSLASVDDSVSISESHSQHGVNNDINKINKTTPEDVMGVLDNSIKLIVTDCSNNTTKTYPDCL